MTSKVAKKNKKGKDSDEEEEIQLGGGEVVKVEPTAAEKQALDLADVPTIPESEVSPAAYIFQQHDDKDDLGIYEEQSTKIKCPYCDAVSNSIVEYQPSLLGYLLTMIAMLIFGFLSLVLMPFLDSSYFGFSSLEDKLFTWHIGSVGVILTRRTILYAVMILTGALSIYVFILVEDAAHGNFVASKVTWPNYLKTCGYDAFQKSPREAKRDFNSRFFRRGVTWDGYVTRVNYNEDNPMSLNYHSANVLVKMDVDDRKDAHGPDLGLSISEGMLSRISETVGSLHRGDHIRFNATMQSMGDSSHLHHLHLHGLERLNGHRDVEAHAYSNGRYKVRIEPHDGKDHSHDEPSSHSIVVQSTDTESVGQKNEHQDDSQQNENLSDSTVESESEEINATPT